MGRRLITESPGDFQEPLGAGPWLGGILLQRVFLHICQLSAERASLLRRVADQGELPSTGSGQDEHADHLGHFRRWAQRGGAVQAQRISRAPPDPLAASNSAFLIVRRSREAIGSFASPKPFGKAAGAEFAWADDYIADNEVWSARGIVAASFVHRGQVLRDDPYIKTLAFLAPFVDFDRVSNSTKTTSDVDNLIYGGVFEAGFANLFGATQYLDISGEVVTSFGGEAKNWSVDLEWQPVGGRSSEGGNTIFLCFGTPQPFGRYFVVTASPGVRDQYVAELGEVSTQPIFAEHNEALRAGPAVTLALDGIKEFDFVPWWIRRMHYEISYGWLYDFIIPAGIMRCSIRL